MIISTTVLVWREDGGRRVHDKTNGDTYLLNHKNMFEIQAHSDGSWMYYADNRNDRRERLGYLRCNTTPANLIIASDAVPISNTVTLPIFPNEDDTETAVNTVIMIDQLSRAWAHEDGTSCYVSYTDDGWDIIRCRCELTLAALTALIIP